MLMLSTVEMNERPGKMKKWCLSEDWIKPQVPLDEVGIPLTTRKKDISFSTSAALLLQLSCLAGTDMALPLPDMILQEAQIPQAKAALGWTGSD